jgi:hypothetical protein
MLPNFLSTPNGNSASEVAEWIRGILKSFAINQLELAKVSGLDNKTIHLILHGKVKRVNSKTIGKLRRGIERLMEQEPAKERWKSIESEKEPSTPKKATEEGSKEMWVSRDSLVEMREVFSRASAALTTLAGVTKSLEDDFSKILQQIEAETKIREFKREPKKGDTV